MPLTNTTIRDNINNQEYWNATHKMELEHGYSHVHRARYEIIHNNLRNSDTICDFGCGHGEWIYHEAKRRPFAKYTGIDFSPLAINKAKEIMPHFEWVVGSSFPNEQYDVVLLQHVIEHFDDPEKILMEAVEHTKRMLIVVIPLYDDWREHPRIYTLENCRELILDLKEYGKVMGVHLPTADMRDEENDRDFEEFIIMLEKH